MARTASSTAGHLNGRCVVLVWTPRGEARRIISMRYAHADEETRWFVSDAPPPLGIFSGSGRRLGHPVPGHQFIDAFLRPAVYEACQQLGEIDLRIDAIQFAGLDQRGQACPVFRAFVAATKKTVLS